MIATLKIILPGIKRRWFNITQNLRIFPMQLHLLIQHAQYESMTEKQTRFILCKLNRTENEAESNKLHAGMKLF